MPSSSAALSLSLPVRPPRDDRAASVAPPTLRLATRRRRTRSDETTPELCARLAAAARGGSAPAFEELVVRLGPAYYRHALSLTGSPDVADDVVQEAFLKAHRYIHTLEGKFEGWMYRIVTNLCKDWLRSIPQTRHDPYDTDFADSPIPSPDVAAERQELGRALYSAIETLPPTLRQAFVLFHLHDMDYEEMAVRLDTTPGAAKMRVHRARERLQALLEAHVS